MTSQEHDHVENVKPNDPDRDTDEGINESMAGADATNGEGDFEGLPAPDPER